MTMHVIAAGASGTAAATSAGMFAAAGAISHDTYLLLVPAAVSSMAAIVGAGIALLSYMRHRNDADALTSHEEHDDRRFDQLEQLILTIRSGA